MKLRLHLKHPRHIISTTAFWFVACLPWIALAILFVSAIYFSTYVQNSPILLLIILVAPSIASTIRDALLETSEEKEKMVEKLHAPISKRQVFGFFVLVSIVFIGAVLFIYLAGYFSGKDLSWLYIAMMLVAFVVIPRDIILQYRRAQK